MVTIMEDKLRLESRLTEDDVQKNFENLDFFSEVMSGLEEALDHARGQTRSTTVIRKRSLPDIDVAAERKALNLTQKSFAAIFGVSKRTVEAWEAGKSNPSPTARNLIYLISRDHSLIHTLEAAYD